MQLLIEEVERLLRQYAETDVAKNNVVPFVAANSIKMNHMYEDIGFQNRKQMGRFMTLHFPKLAKLKPVDKLWKKHIYDLIGKVAPACATCPDQEGCFRCLL